LGVIYYQIGQYSEAETLFRQSLEISRELGDRYGEALDLSNLTGLYEVLGQDERALQYGEESLTLCSAIGAAEREGGTLTSLGVIAQRLQLFDVAEALIRRAIDMADSTPDLRSKASRLRALAETKLQSGDWENAAGSGWEAINVAQRIGTKDIEAEASITLAAICNAMGRRPEAAHHAARAIEIGRELGAPQIEKAARDELERALTEIAVPPNERHTLIATSASGDSEAEHLHKLRRRLRDLSLRYQKH
jgi:tetratricopeptide (TPR) repeat protein